jgi:hypothetical protein
MTLRFACLRSLSVAIRDRRCSHHRFGKRLGWDRGLGTQDRDRRYEAVSTPRNRFHIARRFGDIVQGVSNFSDGYAEAVVEFDEGIVWPQTLPEFLTGNDFIGALDQHQEKPIRETLNFNPDAISRQCFLTSIEFERAEAVMHSSAR